MKVLIACEESQRVCIAFRDRGHEAYSCDIQEPSDGDMVSKRQRETRRGTQGHVYDRQGEKSSKDISRHC